MSAVALNIDGRRRSRSPLAGRTAYDGAPGRRPRQDRARPRRVGDLRRDRPVGADRARLRSAVDAHAVAALRRDDLYLLADPGGVPVRPGHRQQRRFAHRRPHRASAAGARLVPDAALRRDGLDLLHAHRVAAVLADQPVDQRDLGRHLVHLPARFRPRPVGDAARRRCSGAPASRSRSRRSRRGARIRRGWSAASTPRTRWAPSPAPSAAACC